MRLQGGRIRRSKRLKAQPLARRLTDELRLPAFELRPGSDGYLWPRWR
jgi:hypothetical protein